MAFTYRLENEDGTPADPPVLHTAVPNWSPGDTIPLSADRSLRVIETRVGGRRACVGCRANVSPLKREGCCMDLRVYSSPQ
jgi:hypothetical protein